jgi:hypothetical protein
LVRLCTFLLLQYNQGVEAREDDSPEDGHDVLIGHIIHIAEPYHPVDRFRMLPVSAAT